MQLETKYAIFVFWIFLQVQGTKGKLFKCLFSVQVFLNPGLAVCTYNLRTLEDWGRRIESSRPAWAI